MTAEDLNSEIDKKNNVKSFIQNLFDKVKNTLQTDANNIQIGKISTEGLKFFEDLSGIKMKTDTRFTIDESTLRHWYNTHYGKNEKDKKHSIPLTDNDIQNVIDVIIHPNDVLFEGYNKEYKANVFTFVKEGENGTFTLVEVYANSRGELKPKTYYKTNRDVSGQILHLKNRAKSSTSVTSAHSSHISIPNNLFEISDRYSKDKSTTNISEKQANSQVFPKKCVRSATLQKVNKACEQNQMQEQLPKGKNNNLKI
ncbi:hypothetical protein FACS1894199_02850 [Bacteroidia bacterium]|nr:hypothetical protein FACS1894199_02850 [Bacteroidia bacterium]